MVLVLSENANAAHHIEREIAHAFYTRRMFIPFRVADTLPRRSFLFYIGNVPSLNAGSPPAEQHLEALTARIKGLVRDGADPGNAVPLRSARQTTATLNFPNSWIGALRASHYRTLGILKWIAVIGTNIQLYAFRLMAGCKREPNSVGSRWTSGYASHHASRALGKLDTFAAIGHYTGGASCADFGLGVPRSSLTTTWNASDAALPSSKSQS